MVDILTLLGSAPTDWAPTLTLAFLVAFPPARSYSPLGSTAALMGILLALGCVAGLIAPSLRQQSVFWLALAAIHSAWLISAYFTADNHHYLMAYWMVGIAVALANQSNYPFLLARTAELLLGTCFACAVYAKLANRRYRDGSFFLWCLLHDTRFTFMSRYPGGLSEEIRRSHVVANEAVRSGTTRLADVPVPSRLRSLAAWLTWWTIGIEATVAGLFLLSTPSIEVARVVVLGVFALTTFSFVSVPTFGQLLLILLVCSISDVGLRQLVLFTAMSIALVAFLPQLTTRLLRSRMAAGPPVSATEHTDASRGHLSILGGGGA